MAQNIWSSLASTDGNLAANWSLGHVPQAGDDLLFDATSVINCTFTASVGVQTITIAAAYSGNWNQGTQAITTSGSILIDGTGSRTLNATITITGDGDFHIGSTMTMAVAPATTDLILQGTGNLDINKIMSSSIAFRNVTCAASTKTTTITNTVTMSMSGVLTLSNGGVLNISSTTGITFNPTGVIEPIVQNGASITNGTSAFLFTFTPVGASTITIGTLNIGACNITINDRTAVTVTYTQTGNISAGSINFTSISGSSGVLVYNSNSNSISISVLCAINQTAGTNLSNWTFNFGSSSVSVGTSFICTKDTGAAITITLTDSPSWTMGTTFTLVAAGTGGATYNFATSTITHTALGTTTAAGATFYNIVVIGGLRTYTGDVIMNSFASSGTSGISCSAACTIDKSMLHDGSGNMVFSGALTITTGIVGQDVFRNTASAGTCTMTACSFTVSGDGYINLGKAVTVLNLTVAAAGKTVVNNSTVLITVTGATTNGVFTKGTGSFTGNGNILVAQTANANPLAISSGTWNGTGAFDVYTNGNVSWNLPAITYTGSGKLSIYTAASFTTTATVTMTGNLDWGNAAVDIYGNKTASSTFTFDTSTSNYSITCGLLNVGNRQSTAGSTTTFNWNASNITVSSMVGTFILGTCNMVMGSSTWTCSGDWTWGSTWTVTLNTFTLTITGASTISGVTKNFYNLILNASGQTITFATGACTIYNLKMEPNTTVAFFAAMTYTITTNSANQWDGSAGNQVRIKSTTYGTAFNFIMTAGVHTVLYMAASDCNSDSVVTATGGTNTNLGNNTNWVFPAKYWIGTTSTDWENTNNWSSSSGGAGGAGKPTASEDVIFDNNSNANDCIATAAMVCGNITMTTGWAKVFDMAGFAITSTSFLILDGTTGSGFTQNGLITILLDGSLTINAGIATLTLTNADLDIKGNSVVTTNEALSSSKAFRNITCSYSGMLVTILSGSSDLYYSGVLTLASGGSFYVNGSVFWCGSGTVTPIVPNGANIAGSGLSEIKITPTGAATISIPEITFGSTLSLYFYNPLGATLTVNLTGNLVLTSYLQFLCIEITGSIIFNTNNYAITMLSTTRSCRITQTAGTNLTSFTFNFGSSIITLGLDFTTSKDTGASCTINMGTSVWSVVGDFDLAGCSTFDAGTSQLSFIGTANSNIISNGFSLYGLIVNKGSVGYQLALGGNLTCNSFTIISGGFSMAVAGYSLTSATSVTMDGNGGNFRLNTITITGDGDFHLGSNLGSTTFVLDAANIEMRGNGNFNIDKTGLTFVSVKFNASGKTIQSTGDAAYTATRLYIEPGTTAKFNPQGVTVSSYTTGDIDGTSGSKVILRSTVDGTYWPFVNPVGMTVNDVDVKDSNASNEILTSGCINSGHNVNWTINAVVIATLMMSLIANQSWSQM